ADGSAEARPALLHHPDQLAQPLGEAGRLADLRPAGAPASGISRASPASRAAATTVGPFGPVDRPTGQPRRSPLRSLRVSKALLQTRSSGSSPASGQALPPAGGTATQHSGAVDRRWLRQLRRCPWPLPG